MHRLAVADVGITLEAAGYAVLSDREVHAAEAWCPGARRSFLGAGTRGDGMAEVDRARQAGLNL
ncbi:hypothetical protein CIB93_07290 [Streptomyces sp. WZ.A104]|nr:hypothetical protein CIB93_07290 [Streptomyces sp. WZ.A104]